MIYIENGPNYYTYTFTTTRENATADAPLENLVLSPLTDGTYRELLFTYNLSTTEKENIANGIPVDTKGKVSVTELAKGTYNNGGQLAKTSCNWETTTVWVPCSENLHDASNFHECRFIAHPNEGTPPRVYTIEEYKCLLDSDPGPGGDGPGGSGSSGGGVGGGEGGTDPDDDPCNGNGVLTEPQQPGLTDPNGCTGIPTMPTLPNPGDNPCKKTKASITAADNLLKNPTVQTQMDAVLKGKVTATKEFAMKIGDNGNSSYSYSNLVEGAVSSAELNDAILPSGVYIADGHSHAGGVGNPSGGDLYGFLKGVLTNPGLKFRYVYGYSEGVPEIYALVLNDKTLISDFLANYPKSENYDPETQDIKRDSKLGLEFFKVRMHYSEGRSENTSGENYADGAVGMAYILDKLNVGVAIARQDTSGKFNKINASVAEIIVPYSGGKKKEGVKVSKCP